MARKPKSSKTNAEALNLSNSLKRIEAGMGQDVPQLYCNGFVTGFSSSDVLLVLERNGKPTATVNMSLTMAKTLSLKLGGVIAGIEEKAARPILTSDELDQLRKSLGGN